MRDWVPVWALANPLQGRFELDEVGCTKSYLPRLVVSDGLKMLGLCFLVKLVDHFSSFLAFLRTSSAEMGWTSGVSVNASSEVESGGLAGASIDDSIGTRNFLPQVLHPPVFPAYLLGIRSWCPQ